MYVVDVVNWINTYIVEYMDAQSKRVDSINSKSGKIGLGVIIKDWKENMVAGLSVPMAARATSTMAEALAMKSALLWCCNVRMPLAKVVTDSKQLIDRVKSKKKDFSVFSNIVNDINDSLSRFPNIFLSFQPRSCNVHTHHMAKKLLGLDRELIWRGFFFQIWNM
uniref:RNase H type-1 domain-containing protein n=1 Tax=Cannabis sativa TaxID=3483 RepID=A0A803QFH0_CANSA